MKYDSNKYLIENKEYLLSAPSKLMVRIEESFDSNITIYNEGNIISTLNENNKYFFINEKEKDLIFKSDKNTIINLYYNITDMFNEEPFSIKTFPIARKEEIMIVKILSYESRYYYNYAINYGYEYHIPQDTMKIATNQSYFFIGDPYSKISEEYEDLRFYLILFDKNIKYEISFIKKYEIDDNSSYYKIKGNDSYAIVSYLNHPDSYITYEVFLCI